MQCACGFSCGTAVALARHEERCQVAVAGGAAQGAKKPFRLSDGLSHRATESPGPQEAAPAQLCATEQRSETQPEAENAGAAAEIASLKRQLHDSNWALKRMEMQLEKTLAGYTEFANALLQSSAKPTLHEYVDLGTKKYLGHGHFGYAFTCRRLSSREQQRRRNLACAAGDASAPEEDAQRGDEGGEFSQVVVKVQGGRQADSVMREWHHGSMFGQHDNILEYHEVLLHHDKVGEFSEFLSKALDAEGASQKQLVFPSHYYCLVEEYCDSGNVQYIMEQELLDIRGSAAVYRQLCTAIAYLHSNWVTHNDVKPENVFLKALHRQGSQLQLQAKLADFGCAEYSVVRDRDVDLVAYTMCCMGLGWTFRKCPTGGAEQAEAVGKLRTRVCWDSAEELEANFPDSVAQLWSRKVALSEVSLARWLKRHELLVPERKRQSLQASAQRSVVKRMSTADALGPDSMTRAATLRKRATLLASEFPAVAEAAEEDEEGRQQHEEDTVSTNVGSEEARSPSSTPPGGDAVRCPPPPRPEQDSNASRKRGGSGSSNVLEARARRDMALEEMRSESRTADRGAPTSTELRPENKAASSVEPELSAASAQELQAKVDTLLQRFPDCSAAQVRKALVDVGGHAGLAAGRLRSNAGSLTAR